MRAMLTTMLFVFWETILPEYLWYCEYLWIFRISLVCWETIVPEYLWYCESFWIFRISLVCWETILPIKIFDCTAMSWHFSSFLVPAVTRYGRNKESCIRSTVTRTNCSRKVREIESGSWQGMKGMRAMRAMRAMRVTGMTGHKEETKEKDEEEKEENKEEKENCCGQAGRVDAVHWTGRTLYKRSSRT